MRRKSHEQFLKELNEINPSVQILERYVKSNEKIECQCKRCNNRWYATPTKLLIGRACPKCGREKTADALRLSFDEVIEKVKKINSKVEIIGEYISCDKPIKAKCLICGHEWSPTVSNLLQGKGCPKCAKSYRRTHEEFIDEMKKINSNIKICGHFEKTTKKIECKCLICGHEWRSLASSLLSGNGCAKCAGTLKIDAEEFVELVTKSNNNMDIILLERYRNANTSISCFCKKCGNRWNAMPRTLISGKGCPQCNNYTKTDEFFKRQIKELGIPIEIIGQYKKADEKIEVQCLKCNHNWMVTPHSLLRGHGCPKCANEKLSILKRKTHEEFSKELKQVNPDITLCTKYIGNMDLILCECINCGHRWNTRPNDLLRGKGCPECSGHTGTSFVEQMIYLAFKNVIGSEEIVNRDTSCIGMELDIYIPSLKIAIEPGSWIWHKDKLERDELKRILCKEEGVRLITIYDSCDIDESPFGEDNYIFKYDLATEKNYSSLKDLICKIMESVSVDSSLFTKHYREIVIEAKRKSRRRGTKNFIEELNEINETIEVIGEFHRVHEKISCRCKKCGYIWDGIPSGLLRGAGCPKCAGTWRKTHEEFVKQMSEINMDIDILEEYRGDAQKIKCQCKKCLTQWAPTPSSLIQGHGCPKCARSRLAKKYAKTKEQFVEEMKEINPMIKVLGEYKNAKTKILCRCLKCGYEWSPIPDSIKHGRGCPQCAKKMRGNKLNK